MVFMEQITLTAHEAKALFILMELPESGPHHDTVGGPRNPTARIRSHAFEDVTGPGKLLGYLRQKGWAKPGLELVFYGTHCNDVFTIGKAHNGLTVAHIAVG